ncbi:helix-turn-helix transcriptional regulator [Streptomyces sp. NPDC003697]
MTSSSVEKAILRVIEEMHVNLGQELTIDDMARTAMFSKFHFTRVFRSVTGTSPRRFLSALRLQEAKRLLVSTDLSVADVSSHVGYCSIGTFSSRFKACVGVPPSKFRELGGRVVELLTAPGAGPDSPHVAPLRGRVVLPGDRALGQVFVGLFPSSIPQGLPVRYVVMDGPGPFELDDVPPGTWHVLAHSVPYGAPSAPAGRAGSAPESLAVGRHGPVTVRAGMRVMPVDIVLRAVDPLDPPVLLALPGGEAARRTAA